MREFNVILPNKCAIFCVNARSYLHAARPEPNPCLIEVHGLLLGALDSRITVIQWPKLRVHPAPGVHISTAGCTILGGVHPVCARFLSYLLLLYTGRVHGAISGCTVLWEVQPASAQN